MIANKGVLDGVRLLSEDSVNEMLTGSLSTAAKATQSLDGHGVDFGLGFAVLVDPKKTGLNLPKGVGFWGGAASTFFWVDTENGLSGVVLTQVFGGDFRAVYLDMVDRYYSEISARGK